MKRISQLVAVAGLGSALMLSVGNLVAQDNPPAAGAAEGDRQGRRNRGGGGGPGGGNFDPAQFQQRMMENIREQMAVKDDAEWKIIEERVQKVMDARREVGVGGNFGRLMRRPGGDNNNADQQGGNRRRGFGGEPSAADTALEKAIDSKASKDELKAAMAKVRAEKKDKEAKLVTAQEDLKKVLNTSQEAVALSLGLVK
ncbi:MAG: hypothetical protein EPO07_16580 [Verrucomicrobia bacterium]|nr:MAG: hypothetical protein EPO07_16580 [Verrucomicrobiota bacterium]